MEKNCIKQDECECKSCPFNGADDICLACNECIEHKQLCPVKNCSKLIKRGHWSGFSAVAIRDVYFITVPMGICDVPEYFHISKEEYDDFDNWKNNDKKIIEIQNRKYEK